MKTEVWKEKLACPEGKLSRASLSADARSSSSGNVSTFPRHLRRDMKIVITSSFVAGIILHNPSFRVLIGIAPVIVGLNVSGEASVLFWAAVELTPIWLADV